MAKLPQNKLLATGLAGTLIAALCCFTPVLVILLGAVGLSAVVAYLDVVLLPALVFFVGITIYALVKRKQGSCVASSQRDLK